MQELQIDASQTILYLEPWIWLIYPGVHVKFLGDLYEKIVRKMWILNIDSILNILITIQKWSSYPRNTLVILTVNL